MKQRNIRKKRALDEQEELPEEEEQAEEGQPRLTAEDIKLLQKQRQRRTGVDASTLMAADRRLEKKAGTAAGLAAEGPDVLQAAFKRERRLYSGEEDPNMKKYIEEQLAKRMGRPVGGTEEDEDAAAAERARRMADPLLAALPEGLQKRQQDTELGPSWVAGITEVPLSLEQKLKNIEAVEAAKKQLLAVVPDDDDDYSTGDAGALRRGQYPVSFGRQDPKRLQVIAEAHAKKARQRVLQEEKKRKKKEEFAGW